MSAREITYGAGELVHPTTIGGKVLFMSSEVQDFIHKLHYGDPTLGWEGDPRLALYHEDGGWVLERLEADGTYHTVCRSKPGVALDERLIIGLIAHDHRRGYDPLSEMTEYRDDSDDDALREAIERVYHGAAKDLGVV